MRVLAVDTTSAQGSIALLEDGVLVGILGVRTARPRHAERLLPQVQFLLEETEISMSHIDGLAVAAGPGSFVGIRIGLATVAGLGYALERPVAPISTLDATAHAHRDRRGRLVALIDAYRGEVYARAYESNGEECVAVGDESCEPPRTFLERLGSPPDLIAGSATVSHRAVIDSVFPSGVTVAASGLFLAEAVARLGAERLARGEHTKLAELEARYIRPSEAERNRERQGKDG